MEMIMLNNMQQFIDQLSSMECIADELITKESFEHTISALHIYIDASQLLQSTIDTHVELSTDSYFILWKDKLTKKIENTSTQLTDIKISTYET